MVKFMKKYKTLINGQACESSQFMDVVNPATGQPFAQMALSSSEQVDEAIKAAQKAFVTWSRTTDEERKNLLHQVANLVEENMPELMELITLETGKPLKGLEHRSRDGSWWRCCLDSRKCKL
jgi:acyl-CoA reductase-like NAD-dependent aldehyde dehydrogenase